MRSLTTYTSSLFSLILLFVLSVSTAAAQSERPSGISKTDTVYVAPPTGERETDRASILTALENVQPGGTIQFAAGEYLMGGKIIRVTVPRVTLTGHTEGTTLRGCFPDEFPWQDITEFGNNCNGLELAGGWQTVRDLTFEHSFWALHVGCCWESQPHMMPGEGGHLIEGNTFRSNSNAVRVHGYWTEPTVIRNNRLLNNWHSVAIYGNTVHLLDNDIAVPEPEEVQLLGFPGDGIHIGRPMELHESADRVTRTCDNNVVSGNLIDGVTEGIMVSANDPEIICRNNMIRDNTITIRRAYPSVIPGFIRVHDETDSTVVGVPIALRGALEDNFIEENIIHGAEGLAIEIRGASRNRIINNTITRVEQRSPFPGNAISALPIIGGDPETWREANGSGIWISAGSDGNEIMGNIFDDIASYAVFVEGDSNRVEVHDSEGELRDHGSGNQINRIEVSPDTIRYTVIINDHRKAERRIWKEGINTWRYEYEGNSYDSYHFPRRELLILDSDGLPVRMEIMGQKSPWAEWEERFDREEDTFRWTTTIDEGEHTVDGPAHFYAALHPVHDPGVLVRVLLRQPSGRLSLLPDGEARLEALGERNIATGKGERSVRHFAVHGLDLKPAYVWLDENDATFADEWSVLSGWETAFPELRLATEAALAEHHRRLAQSLIPPDRERPLAITGARLFDPETHEVRPGTTILIDGNRIAAVGADGSVEVPPGAEVIEADGRMVLPGFWDMHAHHGIPSVYLELDAPLHLAGGITTARDLGSHTTPILSLKERIEAGVAIGPRLLLAGFIEGAGGRPSGVLVGSAAEAKAAVDRFAELGFVQIKIYGQVPGELVPVIIERAANHGLRVSGHITHSMSGREAVEAGYDELQHIDGIMTGMLGSIAELMGRVEDGWTGWSEGLAALQPDSETVREFIDLLAVHGVAIDPTQAGTETSEVPPDYVAPVLDRLPPQAQRRILDRFWNPHPELIPHLDRIVSNQRGFIRVAHKAGIPVLPGTDIIPGFGYHRELELYVEAGIPAPEVLTLATLGAARVMGMDDELGSIEPGKLADLILIDGDPTKNISDIRRVMKVIKDGRVYDSAVIYRALGIEPCCEE